MSKEKNRSNIVNQFNRTSGRKNHPALREHTMVRPKPNGQKRGDRITLNSETTLSLPSTSRANSDQNTMEANDTTASVHILDLPTELIEKILCYSSYEQISKLRRVCTRFNEVGSSLLNSAFQRLQNNMLQRFHKIKSQMPRRESARRTHPLARECDIVETVHMRLTLLQMTFGKYIEKKFCCFWPGEILDEVYRIFHYIKTTPNLARAYKVTDELFDLTTMAMEYFKEYVEPNLPEITYFATDFLDYTTFSTAGMKSSTWKGSTPTDSLSCSNSPGPVDEHPEMPSTNVMLKKKLKLLRQGMKKNNSQLTVLKRELSSCSNKMADQQKQLMEYNSRFEDYDKKFEENSRKFSAVLQELNKCKTELQYWRSKSPANMCCCSSTPDSLKSIDEAAIEGGDSIINLPELVSSPESNFATDGFIPIPIKDELMEGGTCSIADQTSECLVSKTFEVFPTRSSLVTSTKQKSSGIKSSLRLNLRSKRKTASLVDEVKEPLAKRSKKSKSTKCMASQ